MFNCSFIVVVITAGCKNSATSTFSKEACGSSREGEKSDDTMSLIAHHDSRCLATFSSVPKEKEAKEARNKAAKQEI